MQQDAETAKQIYEGILSGTGEALSTNDFEAFSQYFCLPFSIQTFDGERHVKTKEEFRETFDSIVGFYTRTGVTDMARHCVEAAFKSHEQIEAVHETRLISGVVFIQAPFATFAKVRFSEGRWQVTDMSYAIPDKPEHNAALLCQRGLSNANA